MMSGLFIVPSLREAVDPLLIMGTPPTGPPAPGFIPTFIWFMVANGGTAATLACGFVEDQIGRRKIPTRDHRLRPVSLTRGYVGDAWEWMRR
jgi:hypothetical protein